MNDVYKNAIKKLIEARDELTKWDHYFARSCDYEKLCAAKKQMNEAWEHAEKIIETNYSE